MDAYLIRLVRTVSPGIKIISLGRPENEGVLRALCQPDDYVAIDIPVVKSQKLRFLGVFSSLNKIHKLRKIKADLCINMIGDIRGNFVGRLVGSRVNAAPHWSPNHPFRRFIHSFDMVDFLDHRVAIPADVKNMYAAIRVFVEGVSGGEIQSTQRKEGAATLFETAVGLHPGASQPWKRWEAEKWRRVVQALIERGYRVVIFGSVAEKPALESEFSDYTASSSVEIFTDNISRFVERLATLSVLVGVDSFSIHAASAQGVPVLMLNGANNPEIFAPEGARVLSAGNRCKAYPCYNRPSCTGTRDEYVCVKGIPFLEVIKAVEEIVG